MAAALGLWACASVPGQVKVTGGTIQGLVLDDMCVYKGIPFAAPPVGELRWKAPQPVVAWDGSPSWRGTVSRNARLSRPTRCRATAKGAARTACT